MISLLNILKEIWIVIGIETITSCQLNRLEMWTFFTCCTQYTSHENWNWTEFWIVVVVVVFIILSNQKLNVKQKQTISNTINRKSHRKGNLSLWTNSFHYNIESINFTQFRMLDIFRSFFFFFMQKLMIDET